MSEFSANNRREPRVRRRTEVPRPHLVSQPEIKSFNKSPNKKFYKLALLIFAITMAIFLILGLFNIFSAKNPTDYKELGTKEVIINIPKGADGSEIAQILFDNKVVASPEAFSTAFAADSRSRSIQFGHYRLKEHMPAIKALAALLDPANRAEIKVTIPEGFTKKQVFARLSKMLEIDIADLETAAKDTNAIGLPPEAKGNVEGWLAPLTYEFAPGIKATEVLKIVIAPRVKELENLDLPRDKWERQLIVASLIEREVNWEDHYGKVARVIENRLVDKSEVHGYLQLDSTVMYGLGKNFGVPNGAELKSDTPYNTYKHAGLPPAPISNPGHKALKATINPPKGDWLYFVTVNLDSGETKFSKTLKEHNKNVELLRTWLKENKDDE